MKEYLEQREDYNLVNDISFGTNFSTENIKQQLMGILFKTGTLNANFLRSLVFLESQLDNVLEANKSLELIESRFNNVRTSIDFISNSRYNTSDNTKAISVVDITKGNFKNTFYNIGLSGITFDKAKSSERTGNVTVVVDTQPPVFAPYGQLNFSNTGSISPVDGGTFTYSSTLIRSISGNGEISADIYLSYNSGPPELLGTILFKDGFIGSKPFTFNLGLNQPGEYLISMGISVPNQPAGEIRGDQPTYLITIGDVPEEPVDTFWRLAGVGSGIDPAYAIFSNNNRTVVSDGFEDINGPNAGA